MPIPPLQDLDPCGFERPRFPERPNAAGRALAEPGGVAATIPNQDILIGTPTLQEARVSPATENIVTTQDDLDREDGPADAAGTAIREVLRHRHALRAGFEQVRRAGLPTLDSIHPFGDGTGRIVNALYLAKEALLEIPVPLQRDASPGRPGRATIPDTARATLVR